MKYLVIVEGDTNDADYIEQVSEIEEKEIEQLTRIVNAIKDYTKENPYRHNWPVSEWSSEVISDIYGDILTDDDIEFMYGITPCGEYGIHTIENIRLLKVEEDIKLF